MELISIQTAILVILAVFAVRFLPKKARDIVLAALTVYVLYKNNSIVNFLITLAILAAIYGAGNLIAKGRRGRLISCLAVIGLVAGMIFWKYSGFFINIINSVTNLAGKQSCLSETAITSPFGISYVFLILISYVLGVYWGLTEPVRNIFCFVHTVAFFPLWNMGPIPGAEDLKNEGEPCVTYDSLRSGFCRILWGIFKKLVIAERCAVIVNEIYGNLAQYGGLYVFLGTLLFVLQLYAEFSGAMDIVLGIAEMIGKKLPENFDRPFSAVTISDFWRRWHITLGEWLRNFVLYPILKSGLFQKYGAWLKKHFGKKTSKKVVTYTGLFISWFLIGLWHGNNWSYIFGVGIYYWILIVASELAQPLFGKMCALLHINKKSRGYLVFARVRTLLLFTFGTVFFRSGSMAVAMEALSAMVHSFRLSILWDGSLLNLGLEPAELGILALGVLLMYLVSKIQEKESVSAWLAARKTAVRWAVVYGLIFGVLIFGCYGLDFEAASFIYQGF
ncbi:MAG: hypothetical protein LUE29_01965 [Lachnospiraceae bacterium]|nr:hypothetical protein [Lachnospiraceae bacterium]